MAAREASRRDACRRAASRCAVARCLTALGGAPCAGGSLRVRARRLLSESASAYLNSKEGRLLQRRCRARTRTDPPAAA